MKYFLIILCLFASVNAAVLETKEHALWTIFSNPTIIEKNFFLNEVQKEQMQKLSKAKLASPLILYSEIYENQKLAGYAFFDKHKVRTMPEMVMVALNAQGKIKNIRILTFSEPKDYLVPARWLALFEKKDLDESLWLKQDIPVVGGSTLSSWAVLKSARTALAFYKVVIKGQ
jgi:hypothetical protein